MRKHNRWLRWYVAGVAAGLFLALTPTIALAQGSARLVLFEVIESPPPRPATGGVPGAFIPGPDGSLTRLAQATLSGTATEASGSLGNWLNASIGAYAQSQVNLDTRTGPLDGFFTVLHVTAGSFSGTIDMTGLLTGTGPNAQVQGVWATRGSSSLTGSFSGLAQVPIMCGDSACYVNPDGTTELAVINRFGIALVRFVLDLSN